MKKFLFMFIITFISIFVINIDGVYATKECRYGIKDKDGKWKELYVIQVNNWSDYFPDIDKSPAFKGFSGSDTDPMSQVKEGYYIKTLKRDRTTLNLKIYLAIFPNKDVYDELNQECPAILNYTYDEQKGGLITDGGLVTPGSVDFAYAIYNDDLNSDQTTGIKNFRQRFLGENVQVAKGELIESKYKDASDEELNELHSKYNCITYTSMIDRLKRYKNEVGTCDNNSKFTYEYEKLYSLCESFRATSTYTDEEEDGISAKSCMTACSNLKDDVAEICTREATGVKCGSLGQKIVKWIYKIIRMVRYVIPIIIIIFSILDYIKAIGSDSEDEMKKATSKFFKRLIVAAIIFIIPFILEFILGIFHLPGLNSSNPFCAN